MDAFHVWVANAITECGGNGSEYLRDVERKFALTSAPARAVACQDSFGHFPKIFGNKFLASMPRSRLATTNKMTLH